MSNSSLNSSNSQFPLEKNTTQEPVAKYTGETWCGSVVSLYDDIPLNTLLYTQLKAEQEPKREWVGLTVDDINKAIEDNRRFGGFRTVGFAYDIQEILKEKNT